MFHKNLNNYHPKSTCPVKIINNGHIRMEYTVTVSTAAVNLYSKKILKVFVWPIIVKFLVYCSYHGYKMLLDMA